GRVAVAALRHNVRLAGRRTERGDQVVMGEHLIVDRVRLDNPGPADQGWDAETAFPVGRLLATERCRAAVGPRHHLRTVIGRVDDDRVVRDTQIVQLFQQVPDMAVMLDHPVGIQPLARLAFRRRLQMRVYVHPGGVEVAEPRFAGLLLPIDEIDSAGLRLLVDRLHALLRQRSGVFYLAVRCRMNDTAWPEALTERWVIHSTADG